jgi:hypothetical protein
MGTFYGNQIMRTREAAHRVLIEPSLGDPCTALCVIDRVPKPRAALAAASLSALGLARGDFGRVRVDGDGRDAVGRRDVA